MDITNDRDQAFFRFEDLRVYQKALSYVEWVHSITADYPENERHNLTLKFINASQSIVLQIAEGSSRNKTQFVYFLKLVKSAIRECVVYTAISYSLNYISEQSFDESRNRLMELTKMIGALIGSLQRNHNNYDED